MAAASNEAFVSRRELSFLIAVEFLLAIVLLLFIGIGILGAFYPSVLSNGRDEPPTLLGFLLPLLPLAMLGGVERYRRRAKRIFVANSPALAGTRVVLIATHAIINRAVRDLRDWGTEVVLGTEQTIHEAHKIRTVLIVNAAEKSIRQHLDALAHLRAPAIVLAERKQAEEIRALAPGVRVMPFPFVARDLLSTTIEMLRPR
jgi:hypothetical protein